MVESAVGAVGSAEAVRGNGVDEGEAADGSGLIAEVLESDAAAHAPADEVDAVEGESVTKGGEVVAEVPDAAGGVDGECVGVAEAAEVDGKGSVGVGQVEHGLLPEGGGGDVAVDEEDGFSGPVGEFEEVEGEPGVVIRRARMPGRSAGEVMVRPWEWRGSAEPGGDLGAGGGVPAELEVVGGGDEGGAGNVGDASAVEGTVHEDHAVAGAAVLVVDAEDVGRSTGEKVGGDGAGDACLVEGVIREPASIAVRMPLPEV